MPTLLFVDDEPDILETLPVILKMRGFDTVAVGSVSEALAQITSRNFDVLVTDLNIGEPGDGFTVVSAMRRTQPDCRALIITGYPALDTALTAIRSQVDDYIIKPVHAESLIQAIQTNLENPRRDTQRKGTRRLSVILRERNKEIVTRTLANMKANGAMTTVQLTDSERIDDLTHMLNQVAELLESEYPERCSISLLESASRHGASRFEQGYTVDMLVMGSRMFYSALSDVINENLLSIDLSFLITDTKWMTLALAVQLEESIRSFVDAENRAAA